MSPVLLFPIALLTPIILVLSLFVIPYISVFAACYLIYAASAPEQLPTLLGKWMEIFYITDVFGQLFTYWRAHMNAVDTLNYTLPLLALPLAGGFLALWLTKRVVSWLMNIFRMASAHR